MNEPSPLSPEPTAGTQSEAVDVVIVDQPVRRPPPCREEHLYEVHPRYFLAASLYVATLLSTFMAGTFMSGEIMVEEGTYWPLYVGNWEALLTWGFKYSLGIMGILTFHELGHYVQARRYKVPASLPYFIPIPLPMLQPFGTLGAVIVQRSGWSNRKILFDIAVSGPLAGLVLTIPILYFGLLNSTYMVLPEDPTSGLRFGDPLLLKLMATVVLGEQPPNTDIALTPFLFAGWVGLFVTALNLIPLGQLDGGHILYALLGRRARQVAMGLTIGAVVLMTLFSSYTYVVMLILVVLMGVKHPPTGDDRVAIGSVRVVIGWLTLAFLILGFTPTPIIL